MVADRRAVVDTRSARSSSSPSCDAASASYDGVAVTDSLRERASATTLSCPEMCLMSVVNWPAVWFAQAEAQFFLAGISSETTKFLHVISQLDHRYAAEVEHIISSPRLPGTRALTLFGTSTKGVEPST
jgi:hypothetical protein